MMALAHLEPCVCCQTPTNLGNLVGTQILPLCIQCRNQQAAASDNDPQRWSYFDPGRSMDDEPIPMPS